MALLDQRKKRNGGMKHTFSNLRSLQQAEQWLESILLLSLLEYISEVGVENSKR